MYGSHTIVIKEDTKDLTALTRVMTALGDVYGITFYNASEGYNIMIGEFSINQGMMREIGSRAFTPPSGHLIMDPASPRFLESKPLKAKIQFLEQPGSQHTKRLEVTFHYSYTGE